MITRFNSKSIYIGTDLKKFNEIRDDLDARGIRYRHIVKNRSAEWAGRGTIRGRMGSIGTPSDRMYEYEILVHNRDVYKMGKEFL